MELVDILNKLSVARTEYQSINNSVYNKFVVPFFIDNLDLRKISHSLELVGSRGSGKSTYIQYFSHSTRFDSKKKCVSEDEFECIVLYWKPDTAFCQGLKEAWLGENANIFFQAHAAYSLLQELVLMLNNVGHHFPDVLECVGKESNFIRRLRNVLKKDIESLSEISNLLSDLKYELATRINPINTEDLVTFDVQKMMEYLVDALITDVSHFKGTKFKIFVDEFELLSKYQQKFINTCRKESSKNLNWNVAFKANARPTKQTLSDQWLQTPDDFRAEDLDQRISTDYKIFAAEVFLLTLQNAGLKTSAKISPEFLGDRKNIIQRRKSDYQEKTLNLVKNILPSPTISELSELAMNSKAVKNKVSDAVTSIGFDKKQFEKIMEDSSLAITLLGTHKQKSFRKEIYEEAIANGKRNSKLTDKIHTYEFSTLLSLNLQISSVQVPVYAGFERFITMTTPNVRHFKELCFNSLKQHNESWSSESFGFIEEMPIVSAKDSHAAAIFTSTFLVKEVISLPPHGNKLSQLVNRIGELFKISQKSSYQTEPERDIFTIEYDFAGQDEELENIIDSAKSWRVLIVDDSKRIKDETQITSQEFQLNPIFSPRFGISYRKKRGIKLTVNQFKTLLAGQYSDYEIIKKKYQQQWRAEEYDDNQGSLL